MLTTKTEDESHGERKLGEINQGEQKESATSVCVLQRRCFKTKNMAMRYTELMYLAHFHTPSMLDIHIGESKGKKGCSLSCAMVFESKAAWSAFCTSSFRTKEMTMIKGSIYGDDVEDIYEQYHMSIPSISKLSRKETLVDSVSQKLSVGTHDSLLLDNDEAETGSNDDDDNSIWIREDQDNVLIFSIGFSLFVFFLSLVFFHLGVF